MKCHCQASEEVAWLGRVADSYRALALRLDAYECGRLDEAVQDLDKKRHAPIRVEDPDRMVTAREAAYELGATVDMVNGWARMHPDLIRKEKRGNRAYFHLGDLVDYRNKKR